MDRREGVSDDYDGGTLKKWSRGDSLKTMEDGQTLGCENRSGVPKPETNETTVFIFQVGYLLILYEELLPISIKSSFFVINSKRISAKSTELRTRNASLKKIPK